MQISCLGLNKSWRLPTWLKKQPLFPYLRLLPVLLHDQLLGRALHSWTDLLIGVHTLRLLPLLPPLIHATRFLPLVRHGCLPVLPFLLDGLLHDFHLTKEEEHVPLDADYQEERGPIGGCLARAAHAWQAIGAEQWVLEVLHWGYQILFHTFPPSQPFQCSLLRTLRFPSEALLCQRRF